jgi:hypothetical protein
MVPEVDADVWPGSAVPGLFGDRPVPPESALPLILNLRWCRLSSGSLVQR